MTGGERREGAARARRWAEEAWPELTDLAAAPEVGLIPVGATEQHGPHLPTGTDTMIAAALCDAASERTMKMVTT